VSSRPYIPEVSSRPYGGNGGYGPKASSKPYGGESDPISSKPHGPYDPIISSKANGGYGGWTTSTIYTTTTITITHDKYHTEVVTSVIPVSTTVCPIEVEGAAYVVRFSITDKSQRPIIHKC
jgi:hypothetical protein